MQNAAAATQTRRPAPYQQPRALVSAACKAKLVALEAQLAAMSNAEVDIAAQAALRDLGF